MSAKLSDDLKARIVRTYTANFEDGVPTLSLRELANRFGVSESAATKCLVAANLHTPKKTARSRVAA